MVEDISTKELLELEQEQERLEHKAIADTKHKIAMSFIAIVEQGRLTDTALGSNLLKISLEPVIENIKEYFKVQFRGSYRIDRERLKVFFEGREKQLAYIVLNSVLTAVAKQPVGMVSLARILVKDINNVISVEKLKEYDPKVYNYLEYEYKKRGKEFINKRKRKLAVLKGFDEDNLENVIKLGSHLLDVILTSGIDLFTTVNDYKGTLRVCLSDKALKILSKHKKAMLHQMFTYLPLVVEPKPHTALKGSGGYLLYDNISVVKQKKSHLELIKDDFESNTRVLGLLNKLQAVPWNVNTRVLDVMKHIIDNNLVDPKSPTLNPKLFGGIPTFESLEVDDMIRKEDYGTLDNTGKFIKDEDYKRYYKDRTHQEGVIEKIVGKRYSYMYAIDVAERFKKYPRIYFTYQFDYRYRIYPLQQHLNPQQSSNLKALLQLHRGCILNEEGLYWFKVHGANCWGLDKAPYNVRVEKVNELTEEIKAIADDPLGNLPLWVNTDSPFEYLAFCFSYGDYLKDNNATVHIPVALDATCSGIQVYSGLLRDADGAEAVNVKGSVRNDIYVKVADVGNRLLKEGKYPRTITFRKSDGSETVLNTELEASSLKGNITRKLTKRNVMTVPYSVTARGMFDQVKDLLTEDELDGNIWWKGDKWVIAKLIVDLNIKAINEVVKGATQGQEYIKKITQEIASDNKYLRWKSPVFGLPMIQRMPKEKKSVVRTPFGQLVFYKETKDINKPKMLSSCAPNFIHNLDVTLLLLTWELSIKDGVKDAWFIHDSYGYLPNDIPILNKNVRKAFKILFEQDILKDWVEQLGLEFDEDVMINTLNLNDVLDSEYIFS